MKMKYTAILALAIWLAVTGWLATMVIVKPAVLHLGISADETAAMAELRSAIGRNQQAQQEIASLRRSTYLEDGRPLLALPALPMTGDGGATASTGYGNAYAASEPVEHSVSMVIDTDGRRSAVVDGQRVRAGSRLSDGSRVRAIAADGVVIERPDGERERHAVPSPFLQQSSGGTSR